MVAKANKSILMLSGGLDSTVAAHVAASEATPILALSFDYGQRARRRELAAAYSVASGLGIEHRVAQLSFFRQIDAGALTDVAASLPQIDSNALDDVEGQAAASAKAVWVPNRNGIMIAVAAAWAESRGANRIVVGFNVEEAATFPDNSVDFVDNQNAALQYSTANGVQVLAPTARWMKSEIVTWAQEHDVPLELVWSCYDDDDVPCGTCESCRRFERAVDRAGAREWIESRRRKT